MALTDLVFGGVALLGLLLGPPQAGKSSPDINQGIEAYYAAVFERAIEVLSLVYMHLRGGESNINDQVNTKLYLAASYLAVEKQNHAKALFIELCRLDPNLVLDEAEWPPRIVGLFAEARLESVGNICGQACEKASQARASGNLSLALQQVGRIVDGCACAKQLVGEIASDYYELGKGHYDLREFGLSATYFGLVEELEPENEIAGEYRKLSQDRVHGAQELKFKSWKAAFESGDFATALTLFRELSVSNFIGAGSGQFVSDMEAGYQNRLSHIRSQWHEACSNGAQQQMAPLFQQALAIDPSQILNGPLLSEMGQCPSLGNPSTATPQASLPVEEMPQTCLHVSGFAMVQRRIKTVAPVYPDIARRAQAKGTVQLHLEIDPEGNVIDVHALSGHPLLRQSAVDAALQWTYTPMVDSGRGRCVITEAAVAFKER